ncbi:MAG: hypothetical protein AB7G11_12020 [Phycisphaerales bacterium]
MASLQDQLAAATPQDTRRALEDLLDARTRLIAAAAGDARLPTWLLDQAHDVLLTVALDADDASVLVGVPTGAQCRSVAAAADEAGALARRADEAIDPVIERLEDQIFRARDAAGGLDAARRQAEAAMARLIDAERGVRVPLLLARSQVLRACATRSSPGARGEFESAIRALSGIQIRAEEPGPGEQSAAERVRQERDIYLALALASVPAPAPGSADVVRRLSASLPPPRAPAPPDAAAAWRDTFVACVVATAGMSDQAVADVQRRLDSELKSAAPSGDRPSASQELSLRRALLLAECTARLRRQAGNDAADATAAERARRINHEAEGLVRVLTSREDDTLRATIYDKLAELVGAASPADDLSPHLAFACALRQLELARAADGAATGAVRVQRRDAAESALRSLAGRSDAGEVAAAARWEIASLSLGAAADGSGAPGAGSTPRLTDALEMLAAIVREHPGSRLAARALDAGAALCLRTPAPAPPSGPGDEHAAEHRRHVAAREAMLTLAVGAQPAPAAHARLCYALGSLLARRSEGEGSDSTESAFQPGEFERSLDLFRRAAAAALEPDPLAREADDAARALLARTTTPSLLRRLDDAAKRDVSRAAYAWSSARDPAWDDLCRFPDAEATIETAPAAARDLAQRLLALTGDHHAGTIDPSLQAVLETLRPRIMLLLGRAQRRAGQTEPAFATLRALADELDHAPDDAAASPARPPEFWLAWAELLRMLDADRPDAQRAAAMRLHIKRLELIDRELGGGSPAESIRAIREKLKP